MDLIAHQKCKGKAFGNLSQKLLCIKILNVNPFNTLLFIHLVRKAFIERAITWQITPLSA